MKTALSEHALLVSYLFGELPGEERERIEELCLRDEQYGELLDELEMDLVDAYVEGTLTPLQQRHFATRYLITGSGKRPSRRRIYQRCIATESRCLWLGWSDSHRTCLLRVQRV